MKKGEIIFSLIVLGICILLFRETYDFPESLLPGTAGPAFFPRMILVALAIFALTLLVMAFKIKVSSPVEFPNLGLNAINLLLAIIYLLFIPFLGYFIATFLVLVAMMVTLKVGKIKKIVGITMSFSVLIYLLFYKLLMVNLPKGILGRYLGL